MAERLGVGIVGLSAQGGWAARSHLPALRGLEQFEVRGFTGSSPESVRVTADHYGIDRGFTDPGELARQEDIDLVVVTVKARAHAEQLKSILPAGKLVFCEWPFCRDVTEARGILALFEAAGARTAIGLQARHSPQVRFVRDLVAEGEIGGILSTTLVASIPYWGSTAGSRDAYLLDGANGSTMVSIPVGHTLDGVEFALGEITQLSATTAVRQPHVLHRETHETLLKTTPDQVAIHGLLRGGIVFSFHCRGGVNSRTSAFFWEINGTRGDITLRSPCGELQYNEPEILLTRADGAPKPVAAPPRYRGAVPDALGPEPRSVAHTYLRVFDDLTTGSCLVPDFSRAVRHRELIDTIERAGRTGACQSV
ncbi:Gfo/Idh/MocA family protein [Streptomyces sp. NPDC002758]